MATIGPASWDEKTLEGLILAGVSSCRLNFSHTTAEQAERIIASIRRICRRLNRPMAIRQDLQGPKIRIGELRQESYELPSGHEIVFTRRTLEGDARKATIAQPEFIEALQPGAVVVIGDNDIKLEVVDKPEPDEVRCRVVIPVRCGRARAPRPRERSSASRDSLPRTSRTSNSVWSSASTACPCPSSRRRTTSTCSGPSWTRKDIISR